MRSGKRSVLVAAVLLAAIASALVLLLPRTDPQTDARPGTVAAPAEARSELLDVPLPVAHPDARPAPEREAVQPTAAEDSAAEPPPQAVPFRPLDLYGRVVDALDGAPIAGARVVVTRERPRVDQPAALEPLGVLETDERGRYLLAGLGQLERVALTVEAAGHAPQTRWSVAGRDEEVRLERTGALSGRVLRRADRAPVAGSRVRWADGRLTWSGERFVAPEAVSDAGGAFRLEGLSEGGDARLRVQAPGALERLHQVPEERLDGEVELLVDELQEVALRLVSLEGGVPLGAARGTIAGFGPFEADGAGLVRLAVAPASFDEGSRRGRLPVVVDVQGFCHSSLLLGRDALGGAPRDLPLTRGWTLTGTVRDASGAPVPGATVRQSSGWCGLPSAPEEAFPGLPPGVGIEAPPSLGTATLADGTFRLEHAFTSCKERVTFEASAPGRKPDVVEVAVPPPGSLVSADFTLTLPGATLSGRVLRNGEPARCRITAVQGTGWAAPSCDTNDGGAYALAGLAPGAVKLEVRSEAHVPLHTEELELPFGATQHDVVFRDERRPLAGIVRDANGEPVAGALVYPRVEGGQWTNAASGIGRVRTESSATGRFHLSVEPSAEPYELVAYTDAASVSASVFAGDEDVELVLPASAVLRLDVRAAGSDAVVAQLALVEGWPSGTPRGLPALFRFRSLADEEGLHHVELAQNTWDVVVMANGFAPAWLHGLPVGKASPVVRVELDPGLSLQVRYVDPPRDLARHAPYAYLEEELERGIAGDVWIGMVVQTNLERRFPTEPEGGVLRHLAPGRYVIRGSSREWTVTPERFELGPGADPTLELRWVPAEGR